MPKNTVKNAFIPFFKKEKLKVFERILKLLPI